MSKTEKSTLAQICSGRWKVTFSQRLHKINSSFFTCGGIFLILSWVLLTPMGWGWVRCVKQTLKTTNIKNRGQYETHPGQSYYEELMPCLCYMSLTSTPFPGHSTYRLMKGKKVNNLILYSEFNKAPHLLVQTVKNGYHLSHTLSNLKIETWKMQLPRRQNTWHAYVLQPALKSRYYHKAS